MKIAVLMSTYNGHKFLDKQLKSIAEQTLISDLKLYIRDDGSIDDTFVIIDKWREKIDIVLFKGENIGPAKSFWSLFMDANIQADYFAFCDQDDVWDQDKIERGVKAIYSEEKPALWCSNCRLINGDDRLLNKVMMTKKPDLSIPSQFVCGSVQGCAMIFNSKLRDYIVMKKPEIFPMHDFAVLTYGIASGKVIYDENPSFSYRLHENNVVAKGQKNFLKEKMNSLKRWFSDEHKNEVSNFAKIFLSDNLELLDSESIKFVEDIVNCKRKWQLRCKVIRSPLTETQSKTALRSFKIRVILGII